MKAFFERLLDKSDNPSDFPVHLPNGSCDRVSGPILQLNNAFQRGDIKTVNQIRGTLLRAIIEMEDAEQ